MIKNLKHMWKHHRGLAILSHSYLIPASIIYIFTFDRDLAMMAGAAGMIASFYFIWKYA